MPGHIQDTIAAIATPIGEGAISVIRISGESAIEKIETVFKGKQSLSKSKSHTAHFGRIIDSKGEIIDEVVCTVFKEPRSYSGENTIEINCHGGIHVTRRVLECILESGIRLAEPGEFTKRAFINGKLDLSQAEAIADLIHAQSDKAYKTSIEQLEGSLSKEINSIRNKLVETLGSLELELDFAEEDIEIIEKTKVESLLLSGIKEVDRLIETYKYGKVWRDGARAAIIGVPNAGKSSILNMLLSQDRSIVTEVPGTTRDFIEEKMTINGILFRIVDTAGLRETDNLVEQEGIKRTWKIIESADVIILVHDCTHPFNDYELNLIKGFKGKGLIIANNKIDLQSIKNKPDNSPENCTIVETSAVKSSGIEELKGLIFKHIIKNSGEADHESVTITSERHYSALLRSKIGLVSSLESLKKRESGEFIAVNLRLAIDSIGEIVGVITTEEILNHIFSHFCIGK